VLDAHELAALPRHRRLALTRIARGLTQLSVARRAGIGEIHLSKVERGQRPLTDALERRISAALVPDLMAEGED
jgi:transcriptional regulator with XRE-family HTH domain